MRRNDIRLVLQASLSIVLLPLMATSTVLATAVAAAAQEAWRWEGSVARGNEVEIKGVSGNVTVTLASGDRVVVDATKGSKGRADASRVEIEAVEHPGGVTICAVYPTPPGKEPNACAPGDEGRMQVRDNETFVNFRVRLPAGVAVRARTVNGNVTATGLRSDVHAHSVNGGIEIGTTGSAEAHTVNGSIEASLGRVGSGDLSFHTVNGGIEVGLPEGIAVSVRAHTVNGEFDTDFPVTIQGSVSTHRWGPRKIEGTIGGGGPLLDLHTVNGSIRLRRS